jgi:hypothetical protein
MRLSLRLFHCDTPDGNRAYEEQFQSWLVASRVGEDVKFIQETDLRTLIDRATDSRDSEALAALTSLLETSLERATYDLFLKEFAPITRVIFHDHAIATQEGFTDFERTNDSHYPKYCLFRFASFLDLLRPGHIYWCDQADPISMKWAGIGLRRFQDADRHERASIISRWIKQPGPAAFSEKRSRKSQEMVKRGAYLLSLSDRLGAELVAKYLDDKVPKKTGEKYSSYTEWYRQNPNSFEAWLSKQRKDAMKSSPTGNRKSPS